MKSVNCKLTKKLAKQAEEDGVENFVSTVYTASDEAFAVLMVVNYEQRWRNHFKDGKVDKEDLETDPKYATKYTSGRRGNTILTWSKEGCDLFNDLQKKIATLRENPITGYQLDAYLQKDIKNSKPPNKKKNKRKE